MNEEIGGIALFHGVLYGVQYQGGSASDELYSINKTTGALTALGSTGENVVGLTVASGKLLDGVHKRKPIYGERS